MLPWLRSQPLLPPSIKLCASTEPGLCTLVSSQLAAQTDAQAKRSICTAMQISCAVLSDEKVRRVDVLPHMDSAMSSSISCPTKLTPFDLVRRHTPRAFPKTVKYGGLAAQRLLTAIESANCIVFLLAWASSRVLKACTKQTTFCQRRPLLGPHLQSGNRVYLSTKNVCPPPGSVAKPAAVAFAVSRSRPRSKAGRCRGWYKLIVSSILVHRRGHLTLPS